LTFIPTPPPPPCVTSFQPQTTGPSGFLFPIFIFSTPFVSMNRTLVFFFCFQERWALSIFLKDRGTSRGHVLQLPSCFKCDIFFSRFFPSLVIGVGSLFCNPTRSFFIHLHFAGPHVRIFLFVQFFLPPPVALYFLFLPFSVRFLIFRLGNCPLDATFSQISIYGFPRRSDAPASFHVFNAHTPPPLTPGFFSPTVCQCGSLGFF